MSINIVLLEPEIPQNTGNIARTCAASGTILHLIKPLGFSVEDKYLKRAGLDYWKFLDIRYHESLDDFFDLYPNAECFFASTKAEQTYCDVVYPENCFIFFGKETAGLPESLLTKHFDRTIRIPMKDDIRSLNLSNSVAIVLYEALRQQNFKSLKLHGQIST